MAKEPKRRRSIHGTKGPLMPGFQERTDELVAEIAQGSAREKSIRGAEGPLMPGFQERTKELISEIVRNQPTPPMG